MADVEAEAGVAITEGDMVIMGEAVGAVVLCRATPTKQVSTFQMNV